MPITFIFNASRLQRVSNLFGSTILLPDVVPVSVPGELYMRLRKLINI